MAKKSKFKKKTQLELVTSTKAVERLDRINQLGGFGTLRQQSHKNPKAYDRKRGW
jgi:hypothetical protein